VSAVETLPEMAKLSKILRSQETNKLGLVRKQYGSISISPEESLKTMIEEHFCNYTATVRTPQPLYTTDAHVFRSRFRPMNFSPKNIPIE
jgi:hypothetical protein